METIPIAFIGLAAIGAFLAFKVFASVIKTIMTSLLLIAFLLGVGVVLVSLDVKDFAENFLALFNQETYHYMIPVIQGEVALEH